MKFAHSIVVVAVLLLLPSMLTAGVSSAAARETFELVARNFGKEVAEESAEQVGKQIAEAGAKYGDEGLSAMGKVGPRTFGKLTVEAGEKSQEVVKFMARHGNDAVWVITKPRGMAIFIKYGEAGATAIMKHPGVVENAVEKLGMPAARAFNAVNSGQARRLAMMVEDGVVEAGGRSGELLDVVARYGDKAMDFIWKHKGSLAVAATLGAFLREPEPFIDGGKELVGAIVSPIGQEIAHQANWTLILIIGVLTVGGLVALRMRQRA